jgi:hypothetical protein
MMAARPPPPLHGGGAAPPCDRPAAWLSPGELRKLASRPLLQPAPLQTTGRQWLVRAAAPSVAGQGNDAVNSVITLHWLYTACLPPAPAMHHAALAALHALVAGALQMASKPMPFIMAFDCLMLQHSRPAGCTGLRRALQAAPACAPLAELHQSQQAYQRFTMASTHRR